MDIHPDEYTGITSRLPVGGSIKVAHNGCSSSAAMKITNQVEGLMFHCFKCGTSLFESAWNSPRERLRRQKTFEAYRAARMKESFDLPSDCSHSIPKAGLAWLGKGGWTLRLIRHYEIQWSAELNRVIIPIVPNGRYMGYIGRAVESWQQPKYLEKTKDGAYWASHRSPGNCRQLYTVVTEDVLSAGRCAKFLPSYSALGTSLGASLINELSRYAKVYVWFDPDKAGIKGAAKAIQQLSLLTEVEMLKSRDDPKRLTNDEIGRLLVSNQQDVTPASHPQTRVQ
mgnify:CR=1 FL=1